jgi:predicted nuclease of restriction endonuclease-like (RecB) superfamily
MDKKKSIEEFKDYGIFLKEVKARIQMAQVKANFAVNRELIILYWKVGKMVASVQKTAGWGKGIIPRLAKDIKNEFPELKGFSERNIGRMKAFYREYVGLENFITRNNEENNHSILPQPVAKLDKLLTLITELPWGHNSILMEKVKDRRQRLWYMERSLKNGWSRNILDIHIQNRSHEREGNATTNFDKTLPPIQSDMAQQTLKDPYIFDFLTIETEFRERELETELIKHVQEFLIELGVGFAFVGRQYHIEVGNSDFYIDLLFYHLKLRCYVVIELKKGPFKPEYAGKLNFYLNVADEKLRQKDDQPSIGLILCQDKNKVVAEYALKNIHKAIGVSEYQLTQSLPEDLKSSLPTIDELERELGGKE